MDVRLSKETNIKGLLSMPKRESPMQSESLILGFKYPAWLLDPFIGSPDQRVGFSGTRNREERIQSTENKTGRNAHFVVNSILNIDITEKI